MKQVVDTPSCHMLLIERKQAAPLWSYNIMMTKAQNRFGALLSLHVDIWEHTDLDSLNQIQISVCNPDHAQACFWVCFPSVFSSCFWSQEITVWQASCNRTQPHPEVRCFSLSAFEYIASLQGAIGNHKITSDIWVTLSYILCLCALFLWICKADLSLSELGWSTWSLHTANLFILVCQIWAKCILTILSFWIIISYNNLAKFIVFKSHMDLDQFTVNTTIPYQAH